MTNLKFYTSTEVLKVFSKLNRVKKIETLLEALDYMSQYNGRSKTTCIALAMGYENSEGSDDTYQKVT